jgi:hypothetical protein
MSCKARDPYNNFPESPNKNSGPKNMNEQYSQQPQQAQQWGNQRSNALSGRPMHTPGSQQQQPQQMDPSSENFMLRSDLNEAIQYIYRLGGTWPPPQ